jgi:hypothetical protein
LGVCLFSIELSRERGTIFLPEKFFLRHESIVYFRHIRQNFLYICGKIGLTLYCLLVPFFKAPDEVGKLEQIRHAKGGPTGSEDDTGIKGSKASPGSRQDPHVIRRLVEADPIFSPTMAVAENLKLLAVQGVKGMSDREHSFR